ncbi:MAG: thioredoxin [Deltaproteobacteria bacterium]|nr:thioredoxin [Deltaproteobacteria bacterium]
MAGNVLEFGDNNFDAEVLKAEVPVLVDFWAPWCAPCRIIAPAVEELATQYTGRAKVGKINIDEHQGVAQRFNIMSIPTLLVFKGGQAVGQIVGAAPKPQLEALLKKALGA